MTRVLIAGIRMYQRLSRACAAVGFRPFTFSGCRQWPTCSEYGITAIRRHGPAVGAFRALVRVMRCSPLLHVH